MLQYFKISFYVNSYSYPNFYFLFAQARFQICRNKEGFQNCWVTKRQALIRNGLDQLQLGWTHPSHNLQPITISKSLPGDRLCGGMTPACRPAPLTVLSGGPTVRLMVRNRRQRSGTVRAVVAAAHNRVKARISVVGFVTSEVKGSEGDD
jgi:hypothetical protein